MHNAGTLFSEWMLLNWNWWWSHLILILENWQVQWLGQKANHWIQTLSVKSLINMPVSLHEVSNKDKGIVWGHGDILRMQAKREFTQATYLLIPQNSLIGFGL